MKTITATLQILFMGDDYKEISIREKDKLELFFYK